MTDRRQDSARAHRGPAHSRTRLADVAAEAGVTKSVASRVLNHDPTLKVRVETRRNVLAAADHLDYRPHSGARALAGREARALAMLLPDLSNPVFSRILGGAFAGAAAHGYVVVVVEDDPDEQVTHRVTDLVRSGRVDGLLIASTHPGHPLLDSGSSPFPHVFVNRPVPGSERNVYLDFRTSSGLAVDHLVSLGHRRIAHIAGPRGLTSAHEREIGYREALRAQGLAAGPVFHGAFDEEGGAKAATRLLRRHPDITAVYVSTLPQAVGVLHAARRHGRSVPDDLSVISFDDASIARYLDPPLTCVSTSLEDLGHAAVDALIDQLEGRDARDVVVDGRSRVIRRASTGPPRQPDEPS